MDPAVVSYGLLWALVIALSFTTLALAREVVRVKQRLGPEPGALATTDGPSIGSAMPELHGHLLDGGRFSLDPKGRKTLLVFISSHCDACRDLLPEVNRFIGIRPAAGIFLIGTGLRREFEAWARFYRIPVPLVLDEDHAISDQFEVKRTPFAIAVDEDGMVRSKGIVNTTEHLAALARFEVTIRRAGLEMEPAPATPRDG